MIYYKQNTVFDESLERIEYLFKEFNDVVVSFSGGKDSTIVLNLALIVARKLNRLPLKVLFLDQEAEWQMNIDYIRKVMNSPDIDPIWLQIPFKIFNATSNEHQWLQCWAEGEEWMRPKEPNAITKNIYGTDRFGELFPAYAKHHFKGSMCFLGGIRTEESPVRKIGLTEGTPTYKWITWGKKLNPKQGHYTFYPIYDWSYTDVWKAIHSNKWEYCKLYDYMYQYGINIADMRVSNVHHETAIKSLYFMQEVERDNWNRLTNRVHGINTAGQLKDDAFFVKELPSMFKDWEEYRDYLLKHLVKDPEALKRFKEAFTGPHAQIYKECDILYESFCKRGVTAILKNDYHLTTITNFNHSPEVNAYYKFKKNGKPIRQGVTNKYLEYERARASRINND